MSNRRKFASVLALFFLIGIFVGAAALTPGSRDPHSSRSASQDGLKAVYRLLEERGVEADRWENGLDELPPGNGQLLLVTEPGHLLVPDEGQRRMERWIRRGNTLALFASPGDPLSLELGFDARTGKGKREVSMKPVSAPWLQEVRTLSFPGDNRLQEGDGSADTWADRAGVPRIGIRELGKGTVYYVPEPDLLTNGSIRNGDNLGLALHLASLAEDRVWFGDGFRRGTGEAGQHPPASPAALIRPEGWLLLLLALLWFLLWLVARAKRFGAPVGERESQPGRLDEYIQGMASLYQEAELGGESLRLQWRELLRTAAQEWGLAPGASEDAVLSRAERALNRKSAGELRNLTDKIHRLSTRPAGTELVRTSREMQRMREEIIAWNTQPSTRKGSRRGRMK